MNHNDYPIPPDPPDPREVLGVLMFMLALTIFGCLIVMNGCWGIPHDAGVWGWGG